MPQQKHIGIAGAGLVGSLLAIYLRKRGYKVSLFERRGDMRKNSTDAGRSINLALSTRGIRALEETGVYDAVKREAIPMSGRVMHAVDGNLSFLPYGKEGEYINSISRSGLNKVLMTAAEEAGAEFYFDHKCVSVDFKETSLTFQVEGKQEHKELSFDFIIGCDGAYSAIRSAFERTDRFSFSQQYIDHGYKEFHIPATSAGTFALEKNALHIWPRQSFMMIALPNPDGSFTATLFFPWEGALSFNSINTREKIKQFFESTFPDATTLMPHFIEEFLRNPIGSLVTMQCAPWLKNKALLLGDAAHAIVPFYGQGMNAGFEDCRILNKLLKKTDDVWEEAIAEFSASRKSDTDAIAQLALANFIEMRDLVADKDFLLRKSIEAKLHALFPEKWIPLYSMVTFHDEISYSQALFKGRRQKEIMDEVMKTPEIESNWASLDFQAIVDRLSS